MEKENPHDHIKKYKYAFNLYSPKNDVEQRSYLKKEIKLTI